MKKITLNIIIIIIGTIISIILYQKTRINENAIQHHWLEEIKYGQAQNSTLKDILKIKWNDEEKFVLNNLYLLHSQILKSERNDPELNNQLQKIYPIDSNSHLSNLEIFNIVNDETSPFKKDQEYKIPERELIITEIQKAENKTVSIHMKLVENLNSVSMINFYHKNKLIDSLDVVNFKKPLKELEAYTKMFSKQSDRRKIQIHE